ncbi:MAG: RNA pseudouridine synthase, partial [Cyclobacteriaceae bacterium]|nr:RNA pseudouridine synthase [Cyclobacteriaceae bacterium HetDA_MAG_MS6]
PVSGLVILARTSKSLERMNKLFREDQITKTYLAIVENKPEIEKHTLIHWIEKDDQKNRSRAYSKAKGKAKRSELSYELIAIQKDKALCLVEPKTGRPHQIRVQLAKIGSPIQGDLKYGATQPNPDKSISLHAYKLSFVHPVRKQLLEVKASPPGPEWKPYLNWINELD